MKPKHWSTKTINWQSIRKEYLKSDWVTVSSKGQVQLKWKQVSRAPLHLQPISWRRITKGTPRRWGPYFPTAPPLRTASSMSFTKSYLFGSVTEGHSFSNQHSVILYIYSLSLSCHGTIPLRPLSTTTSSSPIVDSPCSWNTDFWFRNFPV